MVPLLATALFLLSTSFAWSWNQIPSGSQGKSELPKWSSLKPRETAVKPPRQAEQPADQPLLDQEEGSVPLPQAQQQPQEGSSALSYGFEFDVKFKPDRDASSLRFDYSMSVKIEPPFINKGKMHTNHYITLNITHSPELEFLNATLKEFYFARFGQIYQEIGKANLAQIRDSSDEKAQEEKSKFLSSVLEELNAGNITIPKEDFLKLQKLLSKNYKITYDLDPSVYNLSDIQEKAMQSFDEKSNNPAHLLGLTETRFKVHFESLHVGPLWAVRKAKVEISSKIFVRPQDYLKEKADLLNQYYRGYMALKNPLTAADLQGIVYVHEKEHASHGKNAYDEIESTVFPNFKKMVTVNIADLKSMVETSETAIRDIWNKNWSKSEMRAQTAELQYVCRQFSTIEDKDNCAAIVPKP